MCYMRLFRGLFYNGFRFETFFYEFFFAVSQGADVFLQKPVVNVLAAHGNHISLGKFPALGAHPIHGIHHRIEYDRLPVFSHQAIITPYFRRLPEIYRYVDFSTCQFCDPYKFAINILLSNAGAAIKRKATKAKNFFMVWF